MEKENELDGKIDWRMNSDIIFNLVRAWTNHIQEQHLNLIKENHSLVSKIKNLAKNIELGKIIGFKRKPIVKCGRGALVLEKLNPKSILS